MKSRLYVKELENRIIALESTIKAMTMPRQDQASPYSFGLGHKFRNQMKQTQSEDVPEQKSETINYDHVLQSNRSKHKERTGPFGSLGASSQR